MAKKKVRASASRVLDMTPSKWRFALLLALPVFLLYVYICIVPMISSVANSIYEWNGYGPKIYIGLENYRQIFTDKTFLEAFGNDLLIVFFKEVIHFM